VDDRDKGLQLRAACRFFAALFTAAMISG